VYWWVALRNIALTLQWHPQCSEKVYVPTCKMLEYQLPLLSTEGLVCLLTFRLVTKMTGKLYMQLSKQNLHMGVRWECIASAGVTQRATGPQHFGKFKTKSAAFLILPPAT
jgi:hypothetical protein